MKGIILLNGEPYNSSIQKGGGLVVCCDGAYNWAKDKLAIDVVLGDFDSLSEIPEGAIVFEKEKNYTDGELAVRYLVGKADKIEIYGGGGGREDHFLGNLCTMKQAYSHGMECVMITNGARIYITDKFFECEACVGQIISVVPFSGKVHINSSTGLKYPLFDLAINDCDTRGISNEAVEKFFTLDIDFGTALIVLNNKE